EAEDVDRVVRQASREDHILDGVVAEDLGRAALIEAAGGGGGAVVHGRVIVGVVKVNGIDAAIAMHGDVVVHKVVDVAGCPAHGDRVALRAGVNRQRNTERVDVIRAGER